MKPSPTHPIASQHAPGPRSGAMVLGPSTRRTPATIAAWCLTAACGVASPVWAQQPAQIPVYVDDSARAADALVRAGELASIGNVEEAARVIQTLLSEEGLRMIAVPGDPDLFVPVRSRVLEMLLASPPLLDRYRAVEGPAAQRALDEGRHDEVCTARLLTPAGYEAALRVAQSRLEAAQFDAALLTLAELDRHPDRAGPAGAGALEILRLLVSLTTGTPTADRAAPLLARWQEQAGSAPGAPPIERPDIASPSGVFQQQPSLSVEGMLSRPLWSDTLGERLPLVLTGSGRPGADKIPDSAQFLFITPLVQGDLVFASDSQTVSAWNRYTLSQVWRTRVDSSGGRPVTIGPQTGLEELAQVATDGQTVVAITGLVVQNGGTGTPRALVALDARTGEIRWTRTLNDLGVPEARQATLIGPAVLDQGVVIIGVRRDDTGRRLEAFQAIGVDARSGDRLWTRNLGSAGSLAYGVQRGINDAPLVDSGIVSWISDVGIVASFESVTGRPRWVRRVPGSNLVTSADKPWQSNTPVAAGGVLYMVHPSHTEVLALDAATGAIVGRMNASKLDTPMYLLSVGEHLVGVGADSIVAVRRNEFGKDASTVRVAQFGASELRGRAVVVGNQLLVPVIDGVRVYDPADTSGTPRTTLELSRPGSVLPLGSQLLVVDDREIHTYLMWEVADSMLRARMTAEPDDASAAITYAELAYRAGQPQNILGAVDQAIRAIEADPLQADNAALQARLFRAVFEMVEPAPGAAAGTVDQTMRGALIDRLGRTASSPAEQVSHLLAAGAFHDAAGEPDRAVRAYQQVLDSPDLSQAQFASGETTVPAELEATRRLRRAVSSHGPGIYEAYQADATRLLEAARSTLNPEEFEKIARRYPVARASVSAWVQAASRYTAQGRPKLAGQALEEGLAAARGVLEPGDPLHGELTGRLVRHLMDIGLLEPARTALETFASEHPGAPITDGSGTLDAPSLLSEVTSRIAASSRRPAIGTSPTAHGQIMSWAVLAPLAEHAPQVVTDRVMMLSSANQPAMYQVRGPGPLQQIWTTTPAESYLWMDATGVYFAIASTTNDAADHQFVKRDLDTGAELWRTPKVRSLLDRPELDRILAEGDSPVAPRIDTPLAVGVPVNTISLCFDDRTLVTVDRIGGCVAFDLATGRELWRNTAAVPRVHDAVLRAGTLLIAGADGPVDFENRFVDVRSSDPMPAVVLALDARSGQSVFKWTGPGRVRWAQLTPEGLPVVGLDTGVLGLDPYRGRVRWRAAGKELRGTLAGWATPGRIIVRDDTDRLWPIDTATGAAPGEPIDTRGRLDDGFAAVNLAPIDRRALVHTRLGLLLLDESAKPVGIDVRETQTPISFAALGSGVALTLSATGDGDIITPRPSNWALNFYDTRSLKAVAALEVELPQGADVNTCALLDGKLLISTGAVTTYIDLPPPGPAAQPTPEPRRLDAPPPAPVQPIEPAGR